MNKISRFTSWTRLFSTTSNVQVRHGVDSGFDEKSKFAGNKVHDPKDLFMHSISNKFSLENRKIDFRGLRFFNKRHTRDHKKMLFKRFEKSNPNLSHIYKHDYGCRGTGVRHAYYWEHIPEKVPELIVPDLTDFNLKPYVSYRTQDIDQVLIPFISKFEYHEGYSRRS